MFLTCLYLSYFWNQGKRLLEIVTWLLVRPAGTDTCTNPATCSAQEQEAALISVSIQLMAGAVTSLIANLRCVFPKRLCEHVSICLLFKLILGIVSYTKHLKGFLWFCKAARIFRLVKVTCKICQVLIFLCIVICVRNSKNNNKTQRPGVLRNMIYIHANVA